MNNKNTICIRLLDFILCLLHVPYDLYLLLSADF